MQTSLFQASDNASLTHYHWPASQPKRIVVIAHGMAEHAGRYDDLAQFLNQHDTEVWALDHRGHGLSVQNGKQGHFADQKGFMRVVQDLIELIEKAKASHPGLPVALIGHSMGSFIARMLILQRPGLIDGLMLSAPGFRQAPLAKLMGMIARWQGRRHGADRPSSFMSKLVFGTFNLRFLPARTPFDWLSRDPQQVDAYIADRDCGFDCSPQLWQDLFAGIVQMEDMEAGRTPLSSKLAVCLIAGSHDPVSMGGKACYQLQERYLKIGLRDVLCVIYPKGRHELFNETNRDEVQQMLLTWLNRRFV